MVTCVCLGRSIDSRSLFVFGNSKMAKKLKDRLSAIIDTVNDRKLPPKLHGQCNNVRLSNLDLNSIFAAIHPFVYEDWSTPYIAAKMKFPYYWDEPCYEESPKDEL